MGDKLKIASLVFPIFVKTGKGVREAVHSMPGIYRFSPDSLIEEIDKLQELGINKILLFGLPEEKDKFASSAYKNGNIVSCTVKLLKQRFPKLIVMTDVCLCGYTSHGHCGILSSETPVLIDRESTLLALAKIALSYAEAGADYVAPSAMADGQVGVIRHSLDKQGYRNTKIMGYSAKFASQFYGPFRDAVDSAPQFGDRRGYQLDYNDRERALAEVGHDINEGADIVMVKPALAYLDIIRQAKDKFNHILAAYNVSGEYIMLKACLQAGWWDERKIVFETITAIQRAGADIVITYHARDIAKWLKE